MTVTEVPHPAVTNWICKRRNPPAWVERRGIRTHTLALGSKSNSLKRL